MTYEDFQKLTEKEPLILDGATGSNLYRAGMPRGVCTEKWVLDHEEVLIDLQRAYVDAGSQVVYAPTFGANREALKNHGLDNEVEEYNRRLVDLSRRAVGNRAFVAGDLAPTGLILQSMGGTADTDQLFEIYREQAMILAEEGVDLIGAETMMSVEECMVAVDAVTSVCSLPVMCTLSLEADGSALYGGNATEAVETLQEMGACAVGLNCSVGPDQLECVVRNMKKVANVPVICKPNAGLPFIDDAGVAHYSMGPEDFARHMKKLYDLGAMVLGGCCGTTPEYIRKMCLHVKQGVPFVR